VAAVHATHGLIDSTMARSGLEWLTDANHAAHKRGRSA
jgi:hypothetical protein